MSAMPKEFKNRWVLPGDEAITNVPAILSKRDYDANSDLQYAYNAYNFSTARVAKGDFIRMKEISLGYEFPSKWFTNMALNSLSLKIQGLSLIPI